MYLIYTKSAKKGEITGDYSSVVNKSYDNDDHIQIIGKGGVLIAEKKPDDKKFSMLKND